MANVLQSNIFDIYRHTYMYILGTHICISNSNYQQVTFYIYWPQSNCTLFSNIRRSFEIKKSIIGILYINVSKIKKKAKEGNWKKKVRKKQEKFILIHTYTNIKTHMSSSWFDIFVLSLCMLVPINIIVFIKLYLLEADLAQKGHKEYRVGSGEIFYGFS